MNTQLNDEVERQKRFSRIVEMRIDEIEEQQALLAKKINDTDNPLPRKDYLKIFLSATCSALITETPFFYV